MSCRSRTITTPSPARWRTSGGQRLSLTHGQGMRMSHIKYSDPKAVTYSWSVVAMAHCREKGRDNISKQWLHCMIRAGQVSRFCRRVSASLRHTVLSTRYRDCVDFSPLVIDVTHHASKKNSVSFIFVSHWVWGKNSRHRVTRQFFACSSMTQ